MANTHRERNYLAKARVNGELLSEDAAIKVGATNTFDSLLSKSSWEWRLNISGMSFDVLDRED